MTATKSKYVGLDNADIPACYRNRAQTIADGDAARPVCAVIVEFAHNDLPTVLVMGSGNDLTNREHVAIALEAMDVLLNTARGFNAEAAH